MPTLVHTAWREPRSQLADAATPENAESGSGARFLRSYDYAERLGLSSGVFRQANSLRGRRAAGDSPDETESMPIIRRFASLVAPPTISHRPTVLWSVADVEAFEESLAAEEPPAEGQLVMSADDYAGWLSTNRARFEAARALAEGRISEEQASQKVRDLARALAPATFLPPSRNTYEPLWHLTDARTAYEEGRAAAKAVQRVRRSPLILTTGDYAELLGVSKEQIQVVRYYQRGLRERVSPGVRQLAEEVSPPSLVLGNQKRNEVWAIEDIERAARLAASQRS